MIIKNIITQRSYHVPLYSGLSVPSSLLNAQILQYEAMVKTGNIERTGQDVFIEKTEKGMDHITGHGLIVTDELRSALYESMGSIDTQIEAVANMGKLSISVRAYYTTGRISGLIVRFLDSTIASPLYTSTYGVTSGNYFDFEIRAMATWGSDPLIMSFGLTIVSQSNGLEDITFYVHRGQFWADNHIKVGVQFLSDDTTSAAALYDWTWDTYVMRTWANPLKYGYEESVNGMNMSPNIYKYNYDVDHPEYRICPWFNTFIDTNNTWGKGLTAQESDQLKLKFDCINA